MNGGEAGAGGQDPSVTSGDFPPYLVYGRPSLAPVAMPGRPRVLVISIPKSGTYLLAAFLRELGLADTGVHVNNEGFCDYRNRTLPETASESRRFRKVCPLSKDHEPGAGRSVCSGACGVRHPKAVRHTRRNSDFLRREIRHSLISMMRFLCRPGRGEDWSWKAIENSWAKMVAFLAERGVSLIQWFDRIAGWNSQPAVLTVSFEAPAAADLATAQSVAQRVGHDGSEEDGAGRSRAVLGRLTLTWSGAYSDIDTHWSDEAKRLFRRVRGADQNRRLGYLEATSQ